MQLNLVYFIEIDFYQHYLFISVEGNFTDWTQINVDIHNGIVVLWKLKKFQAIKMVSTWQSKYMVSSLSTEFQEKLGNKSETPIIKFYQVRIFMKQFF